MRCRAGGPARRRGQGRALVTRFLAAARAQGAETAFLEVAADNTAAIALYAATGWTEAGRRRGRDRAQAGQEGLEHEPVEREQGRERLADG